MRPVVIVVMLAVTGSGCESDPESRAVVDGRPPGPGGTNSQEDAGGSPRDAASDALRGEDGSRADGASGSDAGRGSDATVAADGGTIPGAGKVVYVAPAPGGSDSNVGSLASPWATFQHAFSQMSAGDTLVVRNGTYDQDVGEWQWSGGQQMATSAPPSGTSSARTYLHGETVGGVVVHGLLQVVGWQYATIENLSFVPESGTDSSLVTGGAAHVEIKRCGFKRGIDTSGASYILKEDVWAWGANRYVISNYDANHIVDHRVIARLDDLGSPPSLPVGAISQYLTDYSVIAHGLFFDVTGTFSQPYSLVYSSRPAIGVNKLYGIIGFNAGSQLGGIYPGDGGGSGHEINNSVVWGTKSYGVAFNSPGPNQLLRSTIAGNTVALTGQNNITVNDNIFDSNAGGFTAGVSSCANNLVRASGSLGGCTNTDTTTVAQFRDLPRSPIPGKGATVETRYTVALSGNQYAVSETNDKLWPWPYEDVIKRDMCAETSYGWCGTNKSLTRYVWEFLGSACPLDVCP